MGTSPVIVARMSKADGSAADIDVSLQM